MKRVYIVDHPIGYGRSSRKVVEQKTARVKYQDSLSFKQACTSALKDLEEGNEVTINYPGGMVYMEGFKNV